MPLQQAFQPGSGAVQAGFQRAHRNSRDLLEFGESVAFHVVHDEDEAVFFAELAQRQGECFVVLCAAAEPTRVIALARAAAGLKGCVELGRGAHEREGLPAVAPFIVNKLVVNDAAEPGREVADGGEFRTPLIELQQDILHEIFRICLRAGQTIGQAVEPGEMWLQECRKSLSSVPGHRRLIAAVTDDQCLPLCAAGQLRLPQNDDSGAQNCALFRFFNPLPGNNDCWGANC